MDIPRPDQARRKRRQRLAVLMGCLGLISSITVGLARLKPAAPPVERGSLLFDRVKRGELLRQVLGNGTLVPQEIRWIPTVNQGRIERVCVLPGARVQKETILVELGNPEVTQAAFDAESMVKTAEADGTNLRVQLESQKLTQRAAVATARSNFNSAKLDLEVNEQLAKAGLIPAIALRQSKTKAEELGSLLEIEEERLKISADSATAQLGAQETKLAQLRGQLELKRHQVEALKIRSGVDGVLQRLGDSTNPLQEGQQLPAGSLIARVAEPARLKAAIRIAETQAKDVQLDQHAEIDTRNGIIPGHVTRVDPVVENGTVTVDVALDAPLPKGARPDLSVEGTIELERLQDVLYVGRPVQGQPESLTHVFKVVEQGRAATRVEIKLGHGSINMVEVLQGLQKDDQIILSDMSQWDSVERVRLN